MFCLEVLHFKNPFWIGALHFLQALKMVTVIWKLLIFFSLSHTNNHEFCFQLMDNFFHCPLRPHSPLPKHIIGNLDRTQKTFSLYCKMFSFLYFGQNRILKKLLNYCENIKKILSSHKNMKKHSQMVLQYNFPKQMSSRP